MINTIVKLFTQVLGSRLDKWITEHEKLPEFQAGFRPGRCCIDNIFVLNAIIQIQLNRPKGKVFAVFVDFRRAFDGVVHSHLWSKLCNMGLSKKFVTILDNLYEKASFILRESPNEPIDIGRGVLQGEVLSPILFSLLIADIENYLRRNNCRGIQINNLIDILLLAYADDIVIMTESPHMLMRALRYLYQYCQENFLVVNEQKTEVLIFRINGHKLSKNIPDFYYGTTQLKVVDSYCYLGVLFSKTGKFNNHFKKAENSTNNAIGIIKNITTKLKECSWEAKTKLFDSLLLPVLFYGAQVWAMENPNGTESIQTNFYKQSLRIPFNSPGCTIRLEVGRTPLICEILKHTLSWTEKILSMPNDRYPKLCFNILKSMSQKNTGDPGFNWFSQVERIFHSFGYDNFWKNINLNSIKNQKDLLLHEFKISLYKGDCDQLHTSSALLVLPFLQISEGPQCYFKYHLSFHKLCIYTQLRFFNFYNPKFITSVVNKLDVKADFCPICGLPEKEDIFHMLFVCTKYSDIRSSTFGDSTDMETLFSLTQNDIKRLIQYVEKIMLIRFKIFNDQD